MRIPFTKAHGAKNDFLLTWINEAPRENRSAAAIALCDRHTGIGADGWYLITAPSRQAQFDAAIHLYNSDGSEAELSGNGTRCAAAFLVDSGIASEFVRIQTGAGLKVLQLVERSGLTFRFEMEMGVPHWEPGNLRYALPAGDAVQDATIIDVGNPQCAVFVDSFDFDWRSLGAAVERHSMFPNRTNVSFVRPVDEHSIEVLFWERGAGETMSSGTGSTGAAAAAILRGLVKSPVRVITPAGVLDLRWDSQVYLTGPAQIVGGGEFYWN
jgi:diaminopimelate epimerase